MADDESPMFSRFTEAARATTIAAVEEAKVHESQVATVHLLLGMFTVATDRVANDAPPGLAVDALGDEGVTEGMLRERVDADLVALSWGGTERATDEPGETKTFTAESKAACELALRQALSLGHNYIGTEHLLLAMLGQDGTSAVALLSDVKREGAPELRLEVFRAAVMARLSGGARENKRDRPQASVTVNEKPEDLLSVSVAFIAVKDSMELDERRATADHIRQRIAKIVDSPDQGSFV